MMAVIRRPRPTNVTKEGRKKDTGKGSGGGPGPGKKSSGNRGSGGSGRELTPFEKLAKERGVDLQAEQERARSQLETGQRVGGTTPSSQRGIAAARGGTERVDLSKIPIADPSTPYATLDNPNPDGSFQYETPDGVLHHVSATGVDTILDPGAIAQITASDITSFGFAVGGLLVGTLAGIGIITAKTAASQAIGTTAGFTIGGTAGTAGTYAVNTVSAKLTQSWLASLGAKVFTASTIIAAIGSYPFAGFIKEEALQTVGFGINTALNNGNTEGAEIALQQQREILNPVLWQKITNGIPFANVLTNLNEFYEASRIKMAIDEQRLEDMRMKQETGETEEQRWQRVDAKEKAQDTAAVDYYNEQRRQMLIWEQEARAAERAAVRAEEKAARNDDANFWAEQRELQRQKEAEDREAIAKFWAAYRKANQKAADNNRPSNLKFGLL